MLTNDCASIRSELIKSSLCQRCYATGNEDDDVARYGLR
jgi:ribosomal protein L40E